MINEETASYLAKLFGQEDEPEAREGNHVPAEGSVPWIPEPRERIDDRLARMYREGL